jgi:AcrR family transcriptional regulator
MSWSLAAKGVVRCFDVDQNMSDHSLFILAFGTTDMAAKVRTNPRKSAVQKRSRVTVNALLEATARILVREGFHKASTNRIAEVAGVSVGSLYQYFPSKEALVAALIDRHNQEVTHAVRGELAEADGLPMAQAVRKLVAMAVKAHRIDPKLHRVLAEQIPRVGRLEKLETVNRQNYALFQSYLERHRNEIRPVDLELAAFICVTTIEALTHTAVLHHKIVSDEAMEALVEETTRLIVGYLTN